MKIKDLFLFLFVSLVVTSASYSNQAQINNCPNIKGEWSLNGKKAKITDLGNCKIGMTYVGDKASLWFEGSFGKTINKYKYEGYVYAYDKTGGRCKVRVNGELLIQGNILRTTLNRSASGCIIPEELNGALVLTR